MTIIIITICDNRCIYYYYTYLSYMFYYYMYTVLLFMIKPIITIIYYHLPIFVDL